MLNRLLPEYIIPNLQVIIQVVILLIAGYVSGRVVKIVMSRLLGAIGLKKITSKTWAESVLRSTGYRGTVVELISDLVKWLVYILFLAMIIQLVGLPGIADVFTQIAVFMPRFIASIVIIIIGFMIADFFGKVFEEAGRKFLEDVMLAKLSGGLVKYSMALIAIIMALSLLGLDTATLTIMFAIIFSTIVVVMVIGIKDIFPHFSAGMQLRHSLRPGEHVRIGEYSGIVEKVDSISVVLRGKDSRVTIPNSLVLSLPIERFLKKPQSS